MLQKSVTILGQKWKVYYQKKVIQPDTGIEVAGYCDKESKKIFVKLEKDEKETLHTFWHEYFHACFHRMSLHQTDAWCHNLEEIIVDQLASAMIDNFD